MDTEDIPPLPQPNRLKWTLNDDTYELFPWLRPTKTLGRGAYSAVCEVIYERTKKKYAVKKHIGVFNGWPRDDVSRYGM